MIITIGSTKGGVGKSSLTVNLAAELVRQGKRCIIVDADPTATSQTWGRDRAEQSPGCPHITVTEARGKIRAKLLDLEEAYGTVLVDVGGHDSQEFRQAGVTSDLLIVPVTTSQLDLDSLPKIEKLLEDFTTFNPDLTVRGVFNRIETNPQSDGRLKEARAYVASDFPEIPFYDAVIHDRKAYQDVMRVGRSVIEWTDYKAKAEFQVLAKEITND